ncbi:hypothetical protein TQ38_021560 [Novosphingobium sp. P6W]|nr:hypothetical protein TQ38_021560 [Novosphingobium sp. P6W]
MTHAGRVELANAIRERYSLRQLNTLQRRVRAWRQDAVNRLISDLSGPVTAAGIRVHVPPYAHPN